MGRVIRGFLYGATLTGELAIICGSAQQRFFMKKTDVLLATESLDWAVSGLENALERVHDDLAHDDDLE